MSEAPGYELRDYRPGDEEDFLPLLQSTLGETAAAPQSRLFWSWKHLENPFGRSYGVYAWDGRARRPLALRVLMRWRFVAPGGGSVEAARAVDTATDPACRRMGLFTALTTRAVADLAGAGTGLIFNTPNPSSLPGYLKLGWRVVASWPLYVRVLRPLRLVAAAARGWRSPVTSLPPWEEFFGEGALRWRDFRAHFGEAVAGLVDAGERARPRRGLRTERTIAYLDWRYGGHPTVTYAGIPVLSDGALAGLAVLRPNVRRGVKEAVLAELVLREADPSLARVLLAAVGRAVNADYVVAHFPEGSFELAALRRAWYLRVPRQGLTFTVRRLAAVGTDPLRADAWDLSAGDLEVF